MPEYASIARHAINPRADGTVAPYDVVTLTEDEARPWVELGLLVERPPKTPAAKKARASKEKS
jgi:hypothetical protein